MPSSFTADIYEGKPVTFEQFMWLCVRGMGVAIAQRDERLSVPVRKAEVDPYRVERLEEARSQQAKLSVRTEPEWQAEYARVKAATEAADAEVEAVYKRTRERYAQMIAKVESWTPPTASHQGLKKFAMEQLRDSQTHDAPVLNHRFAAFEEWKANAIEWAKRDLEDAEERMRKEEASVLEQHAWLDALEASIPRP